MSRNDQILKGKIEKPIEWHNVKRVLVVRLRSIGDTVLTTPSLIALRRFLPDAQIDILLEDWVVPLLEGFDAVDNIVSIPTKDTLTPHGKISRSGLFAARSLIAWSLRETRYDVAFNLHGGTTATFFTAASRATHRIGLENYQYSLLYNHLFPSPAVFWNSEKIHSAEQQLALLGFAGVPVKDRPKSRLAVTEEALSTLDKKLSAKMQGNVSDIALLHPASMLFTKQWATEDFARTAEFLAAKGLRSVAVASKNESGVLESLESESNVPVTTFDDLSLPEITALASKAKLFVGNDSSIAHIAAAVNTPSVVIFGSSNRDHWRPWTDAPNEIVYEEFACQPCPGYVCAQFGEPRCILSVKTESVFEAVERVLAATKKENA